MKTENELIAEFMGVRGKFFDGDFMINYKKDGEGIKYFWRTPEYRTSWDWLMPAIRKLLTEMKNGTDGMPYDLVVQMNSRRGGIERYIWDYIYNRVELIDVYNEFVSCLKWYNSQNS